MAGLTLQDVKNLKEIRSNLLKIKETGSAGINVARYRKLGLLKSHSQRKAKTSSFGVRNTIVSKLQLTDKAKKILRVNFY